MIFWAAAFIVAAFYLYLRRSFWSEDASRRSQSGGVVFAHYRLARTWSVLLLLDLVLLVLFLTPDDAPTRIVGGLLFGGLALLSWDKRRVARRDAKAWEDHMVNRVEVPDYPEED